MTMTARTFVALLAALTLSACSSSDDTPDATLSIGDPVSVEGVDDVDAFCALVVEGQGYASEDEFAALTEAMDEAISNATTDDDPTAIAAIHAWGANLEEAVQVFIPIYEELLTLTDDPQLSRGIELTLQLNGEFGLEMVDDIQNVTSISEFETLMITLQSETFAMLEDTADQDALTYFSDFAAEYCGVTTTTSS